MLKHSLLKYSIYTMLLLFSTFTFGQNVLKGNLKDADDNLPLIGANIIIKGSIKGTITDFDGNFEITNSEKLPYVVILTMVGYDSKEVTIREQNATIDVALETKSFLANEVVVSASRTEERIMQAPVTVEKLDLVSIKNSVAADYYDQILKLKGVTNNMASLTFNTINTRGFGGGGNTRFVQLQDGMDNAAPLLNFPTGNVVGISELDIRSVELIPGAGSALYGPNAFNGILIMNSKDPWQFQGLSASIKTGMTQGRRVEGPNGTFSGEDYNDPLFGAAIRYAKAFNDKFAFKLNFSGFQASDWRAQNYIQDRNLVGLATTANAASTFPNPKPANFDGMNTYGDETPIPVGGGLRRTGWQESDLLESNDAKSFKYDAALHYRITDKIETNVSYKYGSGSTVYQGSERYALRDFSQQFAKWELNAADWNIRAYGSFTNDGDSYNLTALGAFTNENIWQTSFTRPFVFGGNAIPGVNIPGGWAVAANLAGALPGFNTDAARKQFADLGGFSSVPAAQRQVIAQQLAATQFAGLAAINPNAPLAAANQLLAQSSGSARPAAGSPELERIISRVRDTLLFQKGGAGFIDRSRMYHAEGNYNLSKLVNNVVSWQIGGNLRQFDLFSDNTVFNETAANTNSAGRIIINEFGLYTQIAKTFAEERLKLTGSIRYDKNQNFNGNVTPRFSLVYSGGEQKQHNFRLAYQTGFRNPTTQGQFIFFPTTNILLGSTEANAGPFGIHNGNAWSKESYDRYVLALRSGQSIDNARQLLQTITFDYIQPEKLRSIEGGYRGTIGKKLYFDGSAYFNRYNDFIDQVLVVNKNVQTEPRALAAGSGDPGTVPGTPAVVRTTFSPYINVPADISSYGLAVGLDYNIAKSWSLSTNYSYNEVDKSKATGVPGFGDYDPGFNMPKHMVNLSLSNRKIIKNLGGTVSWRWQNEFFFKNSFGNGLVPEFNTLDLQINYFVPSLRSSFKLGATNLLNRGYITNIGNPQIGRMIHLTMTYDQFAK
jgi:outer membrane receptor protein involved in Fe transport